MATTEKVPESSPTLNSAQPFIATNIEGDANTLSPMENRHVIKSNETSPTKADLMTMSTPPHLLSVALEEGLESRPQRRYYNHRNQASDLWYTFGDGDEEEDTLALQKEREERVRKIREMQEEERKKKIEELKSHAIQQQKYRELQETERKKRMEELRARENDKFAQVEERRRAIENAERDRRESLLRKNQEREEKIVAKRKAQNSNTHFAFGSCTPRLAYPVTRTDSGSDILATRSPSQLMSQSMYGTNKERRSAERELGNGGAKRATSAHGLDQDLDAEDVNMMSQSYHPGSSAHRRRTDLMPTITFNSASPASGLSRSSTPGTRMLRSPGKAVSMSRLDALSKPRTPNSKAMHDHKQQPFTPMASNQAKRQLHRVPKHSPPRKMSQSMSHLGPRIKPKLEVASKGRSPSAMSGTDTPTSSAQVRMRPQTSRRPRPLSIATTGVMSTSMYEKRSGSNATTPTRNQPHNGFDRSKNPKRPVGKSMSVDKDDTSTSSSAKVRPRTPAQVKADSAARKAKSAKSPTPSKSVPPPPQKEQTPELISENKDVEPEEITTELPVREATPDIIRKSPVKEVPQQNGLKNNSNSKEILEENQSNEASEPAKKIISSEEEAKARLAEKRREMKEKKEREAELERQRLLEEERLEAERIAKEEEEERKAMEEAERIAEIARKAEEERLQKAIEEAQKREEEEKKRKEEEEIKRKEAERKAQEEAERKQAELDEKLRKDEEERLARKKRLEEIMARTRGGKSANSTPKKEQAQEPTPTASTENGNPSSSSNNAEPSKPSKADEDSNKTNGEATHSSLDPAGDPTKPDLLGDIEEKQQPQTQPNDDLEKGIVDMNISEQAKDDEQIMNAKNEGTLLDLDSGLKQTAPLLPAPKLSETEHPPEFDQILDLNNHHLDNNSNQGQSESGGAPPPPATPLIAFEDSITTSPKQEVPTADLLS